MDELRSLMVAETVIDGTRGLVCNPQTARQRVLTASHDDAVVTTGCQTYQISAPSCCRPTAGYAGQSLKHSPPTHLQTHTDLHRHMQTDLQRHTQTHLHTHTCRQLSGIFTLSKFLLVTRCAAANVTISLFTFFLR